VVRIGASGQVRRRFVNLATWVFIGVELSRALRRRKTGHPLSAAPYCALMLNGLTGTSSLENRLQIGASPQQSCASGGLISIFFVVWAVRETKGKEREDM
jgi:hypothetical protein